MNTLTIDQKNSIPYLYNPSPGKPTIVFINALTGSTDHWEQQVAPLCRAAGFGTLSYNMRGQVNTTLADDVSPDCDLIVADLSKLLKEINPESPILCGLSIGGLYAAKIALSDLPITGLVLLNTLREIGPRLAWLNEAMVHVLDTGGFGLLLDLYLPLLTSEEFHANLRPDHLKGSGYEAESSKTGPYRLMKAATATDWDINYESLTMPVLSISGLQDRVFFDRKVVDKLGKRIPNWQHIEWQNAGHLLPLEVPEQLAEALIDFGKVAS